MVYNRPDLSSFPLPVSSRLRKPREPVDRRILEVERAALRVTRSAQSRTQKSIKKTMNYSELTEDEDEDDEDEKIPIMPNLKQETPFKIQRDKDIAARTQSTTLCQTTLSGHFTKKQPSLNPMNGNCGHICNSITNKSMLKSNMKLVPSNKSPASLHTSSAASMSSSQTSLPWKITKGNETSFNSPMSHKKLFTTKGPIVVSSEHGQDQALVGYGGPLVEESASGRIFRSLATEVLQHIASYLPTDADVFNYQMTCRSTRESITASVWRQRFNQKYDPVPSMETDDISHKYHERRRIMHAWTIFDLREYNLHNSLSRSVCLLQQNAFLEMLRELIIESNGYQVINETGLVSVHGKNHQVISELITRPKSKSYVDIVDAIFCTSKDENVAAFYTWNKIVSAKQSGTLVYVIQLCLAPFYLGPSQQYRQRHFGVSQYQVYNHHQPLFNGTFREDINVRLLLHTINFFQFHLKADAGEGLLTHLYKTLPTDQVPRPWTGPIKHGAQGLARHWKGVYTYLDQWALARLRVSKGSGNLFVTDHLDELNEAFQDISFFFDEDFEENRYPQLPWPKKWEDVLCSDAFKDYQPTDRDGNPKEVKKPESKEFWGTTRRGSEGAKNGHFFGRIHSMMPQQGIHGFQRMVLMKFDADEVNGVDTYDPDNAWAYEGCVLPGGNLIVGRWWSPGLKASDVDCFSGPFLWWNVENPGTDAPIMPEEAYNFLSANLDQAVALS